MTNKDLKYLIAITLIPGIGSVLGKNLISYLGSPEAVFKEKKTSLLKIPGIGDVLANEILNHSVFDIAEKEIEFIEKNKINYISYYEENYPKRLKSCNDAPILLYIKGNAEFNKHKYISIVGTRNATQDGREICNKLVSDFASRGHNPVIVSGLAYGIDIAAHKAALKNNLLTFAVLGHGLNTIYPAEHRSVAKEIVNQGALISEFISNSGIDRKNFVSRNRIVAGISDATIVIESGVKGGALITADIANSYNRDVFAFPGRISDKYSAGCNFLIKINKAALVESIDDIEYQLGWDSNKKQTVVQPQLFTQTNQDEDIIINILKTNGKLSIDLIAAFSSIPMSKISSNLLNLEFKGLVKCYPGKMYEVKNV